MISSRVSAVLTGSAWLRSLYAAAGWIPDLRRVPTPPAVVLGARRDRSSDVCVDELRARRTAPSCRLRLRILGRSRISGAVASVDRCVRRCGPVDRVGRGGVVVHRTVRAACGSGGEVAMGTLVDCCDLDAHRVASFQRSFRRISLGQARIRSIRRVAPPSCECRRCAAAQLRGGPDRYRLGSSCSRCRGQTMGPRILRSCCRCPRARDHCSRGVAVLVHHGFR